MHLHVLARKMESKAISVTGRGGLYGCEMLMIQHCLDSRLIDGGSEVVSITHRLRSTHHKHLFLFLSLLLVSVRG
jgi:hypothetical protein